MLYGNVLITGGAGFLGRGIMRKAQRESWPCQFFVVSRDEVKHMAARMKYPNATYITGDVLDAGRLALLMRGMDFVIHAAAAKHIPVCEKQPSEAIRVNLDGTRCVIDAAYEANVKRLILISTDKACEPINAYGATKMLVERMIFESASFPHPVTTLSGCRYGNIIGSTGSIWPVFKAQSMQYGYLSVTNPKMTRYVWGIDDAADLIAQSADGPKGVVTLPPLKSVLLHDLAEHLTQLWKLKPYEVVGERPGEKVHEMLLSPSELTHTIIDEQGHWLLYGPTIGYMRDETNVVPLTSELAPTMSMDEFMAIAEDSESV